MVRLREFAFIPQQINYLEQIAREAVRENWGPNFSYLREYCEANFEIAWAQKLIHEDPTKRFAVWRVGHLVTNDGTPIYAYFVKNSLEKQQPYVLVTIISTHHLVIRYRQRDLPDERILIPHPPKEPVYQIPPYQPTHRIEYDWFHFMEEHRSRLEAYLPSVQGDRLLYLAIFGSVELAHRLWQRNAVPQYFRGRYQYLLPLYITHDHSGRRPDFVAALDEDPDRGVYTVQTLLPPEWAYRNARSIAINIAQFQSWVEEIDSSRPVREPASSGGRKPSTQARDTSHYEDHSAALQKVTPNQLPYTARVEDHPEQQEEILSPEIGDHTLQEEVAPFSKEQWLEEGNAQLKEENFEEALQAFEQVVRLDPRDAGAYSKLGDIYSRLRQPRDALNAYQSAIHLDASLAEAYIGSGQALWSLQDKDGAIRAFKAAVQQAPNNLQAQLYTGHALKALGNDRNDKRLFEEALSAYQQACKLEPGRANIWLLMGEMLANLGRTAEAQKAFDEARRLGH